MQKKQFPLLVNYPNLVYLDNAASCHKPFEVIKASETFYTKYYSNSHRGVYNLSEQSTQIIDDTRKKTADFFNTSIEEIIFTPGNTFSLNLVALLLEDNNLIKPNRPIALSILEHHSNLLPWQRIAKKNNLKIIAIEIDKFGQLKPKSIADIIKQKPQILALTHCSNVLGTILPIKQIIKEFKEKIPDIYTVIDGAQSVFNLDISNLNCEFYSLSPHKFYGPMGLGILFIKQNLINKLQPVIRGGGIVTQVDLLNTKFITNTQKFEAGTYNIVAIYQLKILIDWLKQNLNSNEYLKIQNLNQILFDQINSLDFVETYNQRNGNNYAPIISFNLKNIHSHDVATFLSQSNIAVRAGHHCCQPLMKFLNIDSSIRVSLAIYNNKEEINKLIATLKKTYQFFQ